MLEADCSVVAESCTLLTELRLTTETLGEVLTISEREALPCSCKEEVAFCVEAETTVFNLLTSCKFGTLLAVVVESVALLLEASVMFETEAAVEAVICVAEILLSVIVEDADAVLVEITAALDKLIPITATELAVLAVISTMGSLPDCNASSKDI